MDFPLMVDGRELGRLSVEKQGLFTVFEAYCPGQEGLLRLSVYGEGREAYLGLMQPKSSGLYLKRKLSRAQLADFPGRIEYAAPAAMTQPEKKATTPPAEDFAPPSPQESGEGGLTWFRRCDGSLVSHDGKSCIVALPAKLRGASTGTVVREIDGGSYMLFRY